MARVGKDTIRKLGSNDRLIGAIKLADKHNLPCEYLCIGVAAGMFFSPDGDASSIEVSNFAKETERKRFLKNIAITRGECLTLFVKYTI